MSPKQVVENLYAAYAKKEVPRLRELLASDVVWNQCDGFPGGANRRGVEDVLEGVLGSNHHLWEGFRVSLDEFLEAGSTVVVLGSYEGKSAQTGKAMRAAFAHVYRVNGQRIVRFDQITDTAPMIAAMS